MIPFASTTQCHICQGEEVRAFGASSRLLVCSQHAQAGYPVVESAAEQLWVDFCGTLDRPVFLLANTGFGDLV